MLDTRFLLKFGSSACGLTSDSVDKLGIKSQYGLPCLGFCYWLWMVIPRFVTFSDTALALVFVVINRVMDGLDGAVRGCRGLPDLGVTWTSLGFYFLFRRYFGFGSDEPNGKCCWRQVL